ncbi:MAG: hypothetical protein K2L38_13335, partial [Dysosmobacter sp.]|nr:hypothetical protein [Dysosmobacter sp.]
IVKRTAGSPARMGVRGNPRRGFPRQFNHRLVALPKSLFTEWTEVCSAHSVNNWQIWFYGLFFPAECGILNVQGHGNLK